MAGAAGITASADVRCLVFMLGDEEYAVDVMRVREIVGPLPITRVPGMPAHVRGVINLRGKVIPVMDLRTRFGLAATDHGPRTCMIVLQAGGTEVTALVDRVCEVVSIAGGDVEETPSFGPSVDTSCLLGIAKSGERVRMLLDIDRVMAGDDRGGAADLFDADASRS
ncbi:MAG TPA: chemotaxis protein CheW [Longimicrobiales bacterium]|nr:chemotaxis protein CheW [Longimicrobiales bacterium]